MIIMVLKTQNGHVIQYQGQRASMTRRFRSGKGKAAAWFRTLRDEIVAAFEGLEDSHNGDRCMPAGSKCPKPNARLMMDQTLAAG